MKIMMYGQSGVGKTTFLMSAYGMLKDGFINQNTVKEFKIRCRDSTMHKKLEKYFNQFRAHGYYPEATDRLSSYEYDFIYEGERVMSFNWVDFSGESIDRSINENTQSKKMQEELSDANAVILFLNSYSALNGFQDEDLFLLYANLNKFINTENKEQFLIMPVFTKCDILYKNGQLDEDAWNTMTQTIMPLIEMAKVNENLLVLCAPIGCAPDCLMNLDYAVFGLMFIGLLTDYISEWQSFKVEYDRATELWNDHSFLADMFGLSQKAKDARDIIRKMKPAIERLERLEGIRDEMANYIDEYTFHNIYQVEPVKYEGDLFSL